MTTPLTARRKPMVEASEGVIILTFTGCKVRSEEDMIAKELSVLDREFGQDHLLLDCSNLTYINSVELGTLITLHKKLEASGGRLTLFNVRGEVYEVFEVTRLHTVLGICREGLDGMPQMAARS